MCNNCNNQIYNNNCNCDCNDCQYPVNCNQSTNNTYCMDEINTDCVFYHLNNPSQASNLLCTGLPSNTSLTLILEEFDRRLCGFGIIGQDTNTVDITVTNVGNVFTIRNDVKFIDSNTIDFSSSTSGLTGSVKIDPASTLPYSVGPNGIKLDCCISNCSGISANISFTLAGLVKNSFYDVLSPSYFTKSDYISSMTITDNTFVLGGTVSYIKYSNLLTNFVAFPTIGSTFPLSIESCGRNIIGKTGQFVTELLFQNGCFFNKVCNISTNKVDYSERFNYPYRLNPQMNYRPVSRDLNISSATDKGIFYFADSKPLNSSVSNGSVIRMANLNTRETVTLAGNVTNGAIVQTGNEVWGDVVYFNYASSVIPDLTEIVNGFPVLYFTTFGMATQGGHVIRLVRERTTECDERANWKVYIIAGAYGRGDISGNAKTSLFNGLYTLKKWYDINGNLSFLIKDAGNSRIKILYLPVNGIKGGASSNWIVANIGLEAYHALGGNINVDWRDGFDPASGRRIWVTATSNIIYYDFAIASPTLADILNPANYVMSFLISTPAGIADGIPSVARYSNLSVMTKYFDYTSSDWYYMIGQEDGGLAIGTPGTGSTRLRVMNSAFVTYTPIPLNSNAIGSTGTMSQTNGSTQGFFTDLQNNLYDFTISGVRLWNVSTNSMTTGLQTCSPYLGGASSTATSLENN